MFLLFLIGIASALLVVLLTLFIFHKKDAQKCPGGVPLRSHGDLTRRAQIARSQRYRLRQNATSLELVNGSLDVNGSEEEVLNLSNRQVLMDEKIGTKKRAKLEAKEQKRIIHKQELKIREGRKIEEAKMQREKQKLEEKEAEEQRQMELAEEATRREKERREHEAYLEMREGFIIEEEGFEEADSVQKDNLLSEFIEYVKTNKIVVLDDLAVEFKLKTQQIIDRVKDLQVNGKLTGVIDDRGKFIFISEEELVSVAKFIKQRGRISIAELAESSNNLINLAAVNSA